MKELNIPHGDGAEGRGGATLADTIGPQHRMFNILAPKLLFLLLLTRLEVPHIALWKGENIKRMAA
jgi:hypothetical protein